MVNEEDPLAAAFTPRIALEIPITYDRSKLVVPPLDPTVRVDCLLDLNPPEVKHATELSDAHVVASHWLSPNLVVDVFPQMPKPEPRTVTLVPAVTAMLVRGLLLNEGRSCDIVVDKLPTLPLTDTQTRLLLLSVELIRHMIDVSAIHWLLSQSVMPKRVLAVSETWLSPAPCNVTLSDPVENEFTLPSALGPPARKLYISDPLPATSPKVAKTRRDGPVPPVTLHRSALSDSHSVLSHADKANLTETDKEKCPNLEPDMLNEKEPVDAPL